MSLWRRILRFATVLVAATVCGAGVFPAIFHSDIQGFGLAWGQPFLPGYDREFQEPPREFRPPDAEAIERWYEHEIKREQERSARNMERIELRFPERWPGERDEPHNAYAQAREKEQRRYERALEELEREYQRKFR